MVESTIGHVAVMINSNLKRWEKSPTVSIDFPRLAKVSQPTPGTMRETRTPLQQLLGN